MFVIWQVLENQGRTLQWFASKLGVSASYVYKLKGGERDWTCQLKSRAAEILDIPQKVLFLPLALTDVCHNRNKVDFRSALEAVTEEVSGVGSRSHVPAGEAQAEEA